MGHSIEELLQLGRTLDEYTDGERNSIRAARELLRIRDRNGCESPLLANPVQAQFERRRGQRNIVVKARQMGLTTWIAGRFFLKTISARGVLTVQVAQTREAAESIFRMVQRFWECLPEDLRKGNLKRSRANVGQMVFPELDSEFRVLSASDSNCGRGLTVQNMHLSEVSRWPGNAAETLAGLRAALVPAGELVMESTPNGAYGCFYEEWQQAEEKGVVKHFFPWWLEPAYVVDLATYPVTNLREDELALMQQHGLTLPQIGFRRSLQASYRRMHSQEFAEDPQLCFRATGDCYFDVDSVEKCLAAAREPVEVRRSGALRIWMPAVKGRKYVIGVDPAGGGPEGDYSTAQVVEAKTGLQCAELQQRLKPLELARVLAELGREYGNALLVVERNNHGGTVLAHLGSEHYTRIYDHQDKEAGWPTNSSTRQRAITELGTILVDEPGLFASRHLLQECRTFITHRDGKCEAASGAHDDLVMAMAIAQTVRKSSR